MIIYTNCLKNNGNIESKGIDLGKLVLKNKDDNGIAYGSYVAAGGASGGGSINIFYNGEYINNGTISAEGGNTNYSSNNGGPGGKGSITVGMLMNNVYVNTYRNYSTSTEEIEPLKIYWYGEKLREEASISTWQQYSTSWVRTDKEKSVNFYGSHYASGGVVGGIATAFKVDLGKYNKMNIIFNKTDNAGKFSIVSSLGNQGSYGNQGGIFSTFEKSDTPKLYSIDISGLTGSYYVGTHHWPAEGNYEIAAWWFE